MFYERFLRLCENKGISPSAAAVKAGFNKGTVSVWKKKYETGIDVSPDQETIHKICTFFNCSEQLVRGIEQEEAPTKSDWRRITDEEIKFALFGGEREITDAMYDEVRRFAQMVKLREEAEKKKKKG